jgi:hypothetical protein
MLILEEVVMNRTGKAAAVLLLTFAASGCGGAGGGTEAELVMRVDTVGDTVIVRTVRGSVWGPGVELVPVLRIGELDGSEEYNFGLVAGIALAADGSLLVLDQQALAVRAFDREGRHTRSFGRSGGGPGELSHPTGLAVLPDGRVLVSDPRNARVNVYSPDGEAVDSWPMSPTFVIPNQVRVTRDGRAYVLAVFSTMMDASIVRGYVRVGPEGTPADTIAAPAWDFEPAVLTARMERDGSRSVATGNVPFAPGISWSLSPLGYPVGGVSNRYAVEAFPPDGRVLRMERAAEPVPVSAGERAYQEHMVTRNMRNTDPAWRWAGPPIPATKRAFGSVQTDDDGRIWVRAAVPGEVVPREERPEPRPGEDQEPEGPEPWREPLVYDVFDSDGRFLGTLPMPARFTLHGARGDEVWGVQRDELGVDYVALFRLEGTERR